jgi:hypothetical protein
MRFVVLCVRDFGAKSDVRRQGVFARAMPQIGVDLRLGREGARPVRVGFEGKGIQMRRHVAGRARIAVVAPDAANVLCPLEDDEVMQPGLLEGHGHADASKARADDDGRVRCYRVRAAVGVS